MGFQMNLILWKHFGAGFNMDFQPARQNYAVLETAAISQGVPEIDLQSRITFYDIDAIYQPYTSKKAAIQLKGGLGVANLKFYENESGANAVIGSFNQSQYAGSSNHFGAARRGRPDFRHGPRLHPPGVRHALRPQPRRSSAATW